MANADQLSALLKVYAKGDKARLHVIDEVVARIRDRTITVFAYDPTSAKLKQI